MSKLSIVAVSGHFDPLHDMHVDYIEQASKLGDVVVCIVSSDRQLLAKKGRVNIPEAGRLKILTLVMKGMSPNYCAVLNTFDTETTLVAEALRHLRPDVFCRAGDKSPGDFPSEEKEVCEQLGIKVIYAKFQYNRHGSEMTL